MAAFIGREEELALLREILKKQSASVMVYGKRKVGKTTLISHVLSESADVTVYYECVKDSMRENVDGFVRSLADAGVIPVPLAFSSFPDVFGYLNSLDRTINVVIDEYPYLKEMTKPETVDSIFQTIVDNRIGNIRLFLSGSHIGMMKDLLEEKNALYGRFSLVLHLRELDYLEASLFYPEKPAYDKIAFYSVFGGSPFINGFIDPGAGLRENIIRTVLNPNSPVFSYAEHLLISDYAGSMNAERILYAISNGSRRYGEIEDRLGMKNNGLLSKQLSSLLKMEILSKRFPINRTDDRKKTSYELKDNLLRFYHAYVRRNRSALTMLGAEAFYDGYVEPSVTSFISRRFEEQCRVFFSLQVKRGRIRGVTDIGTYWYDDSSSRQSGEFDAVLARRDRYDIYEVKYHKDPMTEKEIEEEADKIRNVRGLAPGRIGFVSATGFTAEPEGYDLISGEEIYGV